MSAIEPGTVLGDRFEVVGVLGRGGMATVYLAADRLRGERVALKVLHAHLAANPSMRHRLQREVQSATRLRHPNAVVAHELHEVDGHLALSMPLHPGQTLADVVRRSGPLSAAHLARLGIDLSEVLSAAHRAGIVHRDVTPSNVMVAPSGTPFSLTDFGLARLDHSRTESTGALGTAGYAAPEVYASIRSDPRSDLYALGAVLYFAATGTPPFEANNPMGSLQRQLSGDLTPIDARRTDLPRALTATIASLLAVEPEDRPQSAQDVKTALVEHTPPPPPKPRLAVTAVLPGGRYAVVVAESAGDRQRRAKLRTQRLATDGAIEQAVRKVSGWVEDRVRNLFELEPTDPLAREKALAAAVARQAGLPDDALELSSVLLEPRFKLLDGVDLPTATAVVTAASEAGFTAWTVQHPDGSGRLAQLPIAIGAAGIGIAVLLLAVPATFSRVVPILLVMLVAAIAYWRYTTTRDAAPELRLPVAFRADLSHQIQDGVVLEPQQTGRPPSIADRARAELDDLEAAIARRVDELPAAVLSDLRGSLVRLRDRTEALAVSLDELDRHRLDEGAALKAADEVSRRLERLRTLERAGDAVDSGEIARLERALAAHSDAVRTADDQAANAVRLQATLLEIAATAARTRGALVRVDPHSVLDLVGRMREESSAAADALREVRRPQPDLS